MKEVVRSGREVEWDSEKERGLTVILLLNSPSKESANV
jgi:hypothetical protein